MATTVEGQVELGGVLFGPGTPYDVVRFNPWRRQVRADQGGPRAWAHGSWSGAEWRDSIVVDIELHYQGSTHAEWVTLNDAVTAAFAPVGDSAADRELRFFRGGEESLIFGRPRVFEPEMRPAQLRSYAIATFVTTDQPFRLSGVETVAGPAGLARFTSGLTVPFTVPFTIQALKIGGELTLINEGTAETGLRLRIDGPLSEPAVSLRRPDGTVQTLRWQGLVLTSGQFLDVDTAARLALLNGLPQANQSPGFVQWPLLPPGESVLSFSAADFNDQATITVSWRSAWF